MATNLDKMISTADGKSLVEMPVPTPLKTFDEINVTDEDIDFDALFDEQESETDNEVDTEDDTEPNVEEEEPQDEADKDVDELIVENPVEEPKPKSKAKSPAEIKIINLKKENEALLKKQRELEDKINEKKSDEEKTATIKKLVDKGYDKDYAESFVELEQRLKKSEQAQERLDFREQNIEVFAKYPQAKADIETIMRKSKAADMTAEQICKALYGNDGLSEHERRAINAVKGTQTNSTQTRNLNDAKGVSGKQSETIGLTANELSYKRALEKASGVKMTDDEVKQYIKKQK